MLHQLGYQEGWTGRWQISSVRTGKRPESQILLEVSDSLAISQVYTLPTEISLHYFSTK